MQHKTFGPTGRGVPAIGQGTWFIETGNRRQAITALQFDRLNEMLVVNGLNDPGHCHLE